MAIMKIRISYSILFLLLSGALAAKQNSVEVLMDQDGNIYRTVKIGNQVWMAENLKVTHYRDGSAIPDVPDNDAWSKLMTGALCWIENDSIQYKNVYGALYNYYAVVDRRKLSPIGWHIPTIDEWRMLEQYLGGKESAGGKMKDLASHLWKAIHRGADNSSGFSAVPAGGRGRLGSSSEAGYYATWWALTSQDEDFAWHWGLHPDRPNIRSNPGHKASGFSVRCVKDPGETEAVFLELASDRDIDFAQTISGSRAVTGDRRTGPAMVYPSPLIAWRSSDGFPAR